LPLPLETRLEETQGGKEVRGLERGEEEVQPSTLLFLTLLLSVGLHSMKLLQKISTCCLPTSPLLPFAPNYVVCIVTYATGLTMSDSDV